MICCSTIVRFSCAKAFALLTHGCVALALFVCMMLTSCRTKSSATSAVVASATIGTMEAALMDSSCKVIQWDVYVIDTIKDTASWVPMIRQTIDYKRHALANAHADRTRFDTTTVQKSSCPHGTHTFTAEPGFVTLSPFQIILCKIGMIVCIFVLFFGISYFILAYFRKNF